ncbi:MAG: UvrD-helicase domain-containing protein, partial [Lachnospiraceae bacterium]|nr:UvrD-helicase domain-containing protein [Lachnospiraceae bacterium]
REQVKKRRTEMKKNLEKLGADFFGKSPQSMEVENAGAKRALDMLVQVTLDYMYDLERAKRERGYVDFHDMEHMALRILLKSDGQGGFCVTETAESYRQQFAEVMVDEYQDSNLVQEYLTAAVSRDDDRFMVGDVKQSIYKFRLARPELFMEKYQEYAGENPKCVRIDLKQNFRSRPQVLEAVNSVFSPTMTMESGGIAYDENAALYPGAEYPQESCPGEEDTPHPGMEGVCLGAEDASHPGAEDACPDGAYPGRRLFGSYRYDRYACECIISHGELPQGLDARRLEAYSAAKKIKELLWDGRISNEDRTALRPVEPDDIVLLFRSPSLYEEAYREVFARENIPLSFVSGSGYFDAKEVQNLVKFLECVENPLSDIPMYGVCISLFGELTEEDLARVQIYDRKRMNWEREENSGQSEGQEQMESPGQNGEQERTEEESGQNGEREQIGDQEQAEGQESFNELKGQGANLPGSGSLWGKLLSFAAGNPNDPASLKIQKLVGSIQKYRRQAEYCSVEELLRNILNEYHYRERMRLLPDGEKRSANVELLLERAAQFGARGQHGLFSFVNYIRELHRQEIDYGESSAADSAHAVRMMSIHKSKGLEFPIVIVGGMAHSYTMRDRQQLLLIDNDLGLGVDYISPVQRSRNKTLQKSALSLKMERDILAEEQRIFYVAMTRAKEKLILCGYKKNAEELFVQEEGGQPGVPVREANAQSGEEGNRGLLPETAGIHPREKSLRRQDGACLLSDILSARSYLDLCLLAWDTDSPIVYRLFSAVDLAENEVMEAVEQSGRKETLEELFFNEEEKEVSRIIGENPALQYQYPWRELTEMNGKTSVSELKLAAMEEELGGVAEMFETERVVPCVPEFIKQTQGLGGAAVGTAYHRVLELADFTALPDSPAAWGRFMERMAQEGRLAIRQKESVSAEKLHQFGESSLAKRMAKAARAGTLKKEQSFFLGVPAGEVNRTAESRADDRRMEEAGMNGDQVNKTETAEPGANDRRMEEAGTNDDRENKSENSGRRKGQSEWKDELVLIQGI